MKTLRILFSSASDRSPQAMFQLLMRTVHVKKRLHVQAIQTVRRTRYATVSSHRFAAEHVLFETMRIEVLAEDVVLMPAQTVPIAVATYFKKTATILQVVRAVESARSVV